MSDVSVIQGYPRSLILVPQKACMWLPISPS